MAKKTQKPSPARRQTVRRNSMTLLVCVLVVLFILFIALSIQVYNHSRAFENHRLYLRQNEPPIQGWMTVPAVALHYNISQVAIYRLLDVNNTFSQDKRTINAICEEHELNCTAIIDIMNGWRSQ